MWDEGTDYVFAVKMTGYNTVIIPGKKEMTTDKFFDFFEKNIKKRKITECMYDIDNSSVSFMYQEYQHIIKLENANSGLGVILLNLVRYEEELRREEEYLKQREKNQQEVKKREKESLERKEKILLTAREGIIETEEAKQIYIQDLKESLGFKGKIKGILKARKKALDDSVCYNDFMKIFQVILSMITSPVVCVWLLFYTKSIILGLIILVCGINISEDAVKERFSLSFIFNFIKELFKSDIFNNKMIKHKIENLEKMKIKETDDNLSVMRVEDVPFSDLINEQIREISIKIDELNDEDKKIYLEKVRIIVTDLTNRINVSKKCNDYSNKKKKEIVSYMSLELSNYLDEIDKEIYMVLMEYREKEKYAFTGELRIVDVSDKEDIKVLKRSNEG